MILTPLVVLASALSLWAGENVAVFPTVSYDRFIIYETLGILWIGIIGLIVIIRMKLREIERVQKMGLDKEEKDTPLLD